MFGLLKSGEKPVLIVDPLRFQPIQVTYIQDPISMDLKFSLDKFLSEANCNSLEWTNNLDSSFKGFSGFPIFSLTIYIPRIPYIYMNPIYKWGYLYSEPVLQKTLWSWIFNNLELFSWVSLRILSPSAIHCGPLLCLFFWNVLGVLTLVTMVSFLLVSLFFPRWKIPLKFL